MKPSSTKGSIRAMTANLACGGPTRSLYEADAREWLEQTVTGSGYDLLFLQEVPADAHTLLKDAKWRVFRSPDDAPAYRCRSLVAVRGVLAKGAKELALRTAGYHGSYLAACTVNLPSVGRTALVSFHASPSRHDPKYPWPDPGLPPPRFHEGPPERWDADFVVATLIDLRRTHRSVLAAGDLNESRRYDDAQPSKLRWAQTLFDRAEHGGLRAPACCSNDETPTRGDYQIDYILATDEVGGLITECSVLADKEGGAPSSDHRPIAFTLAG